jgi:hypothetical protein
MTRHVIDKYWLRPTPGAGNPVSGPYTEAEALERYENGRVMWPEQEMLVGPNKRDLHVVTVMQDTSQPDDDLWAKASPSLWGS